MKEWRFSFTHYYPQNYTDVSCQLHTLVALP
jgi:hypothetical protein